MKRYLFLICFACLFLFSSCDLLYEMLGGSETTKTNTNTNTEIEEEPSSVTVKADPTGTTYLVKLNVSNGIIANNKTGYARFASVSEQKNSDSVVQNMRARFDEGLQKAMQEDSARNAFAERAIVSGVNNLSYSKNETAEFYSYTKTETTILGKEVDVSEQVTSTCKYVGKHCYIFADDRNSSSSSKGIELSDNDYKLLGQKFDSCYDLETSIIGNPLYTEYNETYYVPCNNKIIILVSDLYGDASEDQNGGVVGYFYQADLYKQEYLDKNKGFFSSSIDSNECEIFYIDALFLTKQPETVYSTLVHEFNHMINYVIKTVNYMTNNTKATYFRTCDAWFTEMLSMTTEDMFQDYLGIKEENSPKGRLPYFNMYYNYGFKLWNDSSVPNLIMYANTYAFGAFLVRNFGGIALLKELAQNDYVDETAITKALQTCNPDFTYLDEKKVEKKIDFDYAMRKFSMCLFNVAEPTEEMLAKTGKDQYFSFYRGTDLNRNDGLKFTPIDIMNIKCDVEDPDTGKVTNQTIQPAIYNGNESVGLGPEGFSVHYVGKNIDSFTLYYLPDQQIVYYQVTTN